MDYQALLYYKWILLYLPKNYSLYDKYNDFIDKSTGLTSERHRHRFEFNNDYLEKYEKKGFIISARSVEEGLVEIIELPKNYIFGSAMNNEGYALVGCMVSPGFKFKDFELFERNFLLEKYPEYKETIIKLTK